MSGRTSKVSAEELDAFVTIANRLADAAAEITVPLFRWALIGERGRRGTAPLHIRGGGAGGGAHCALLHSRTRVDVEVKADASPVTIADKKAEEVMRDILSTELPGMA